MIVVTHAMRFARQVADCVHVFGDGKILESGPPSQIFDDPMNEEVREFLAETQAA
jgi:polar amino acid transport system ATP-binding protein